MRLIYKRSVAWISVLTIALLMQLFYASVGPMKTYAVDIEALNNKDGQPVVYTWEPETGAGYAILYGTVEDDGQEEVEHYGFYVGSPGYEDDEIKIECEGSPGRNGTFQYKLSGLDDGVIYYVKAFAKNDVGTGQGSLRYFEVDKLPKVSVFTVGSLRYRLWGAQRQMDVAPYLKNDRTYMPVRYAAYAMGLTDSDITWDEKTQEVIMSKGGNRITMTIGSHNLWLNDIPTPMDVVPEIHQGRTCLPIAWVAQAFRHTAVWNPDAQTITIETK